MPWRGVEFNLYVAAIQRIAVVRLLPRPPTGPPNLPFAEVRVSNEDSRVPSPHFRGHTRTGHSCASLIIPRRVVATGASRCSPHGSLRDEDTIETAA